MEHNLDDALNLESAIGGIDFENAEDVVVSQADINLDTSTQGGEIAMEFEHIEEQPILMDSGNEEIIVSDFMGDQFNLQEYSIHDDQTTGMTTTEDSNQQDLLANQSANIDLQFESQEMTPPVRVGVKGKQKYIAVKVLLNSHYNFINKCNMYLIKNTIEAASPAIAPKKSDSQPSTAIPRQIAIAPKLPKLIPAVSTRCTIPQTSQVAIAPQSVALVANRSNVKKVPITTVMKDGTQSGTVLAQIGKQLVVMPSSGGGQKIKLVTTGNSGVSTVQYVKAGSDLAQLIPAKNISGLQTNKPILAKVILQGQSNIDLSNQPAVITKVVMGSPTEKGVKFTGKARIDGAKTKVVIMPNSTQTGQKAVIKTTASPKTAQITKDGKVLMQGQRSQLHQVNIPGKGDGEINGTDETITVLCLLRNPNNNQTKTASLLQIQYIRLISNQTSNEGTTVTKQQSGSPTTKSFVLSDSKGKLVQISGVKQPGGVPPPLVFTRVKDKRQQKLVRIAAAPLTATATAVSQASSRSSQSLLVPLPSVEEPTSGEHFPPPISHSIHDTTHSTDDPHSATDPTQSTQDPTYSTRDPTYSSQDPTYSAQDSTYLAQDPIQDSIHSVQDSTYSIHEADSPQRISQRVQLESYHMSGSLDETEEVDNKAALRALIAEQQEQQQSPDESEHSNSNNSMEHLVPMGSSEEHPLIVISSNYMKQESIDNNMRQKSDMLLLALRTTKVLSANRVNLEFLAENFSLLESSHGLECGLIVLDDFCFQNLIT
ncbi:unnamed protein product [Diatraea saccharalis]|uniref:Uncharacterized protein n=1 Tax=Diatraea saccharalis TaxID=40085 RepID=A0A9N9R2P6_9NEOP|nr:unnamed protein product [Diatraea saccharalis]